MGPILRDIPPGSTDRIWNQVVNTEVAQKIIKVIEPSKEVIHKYSNSTAEQEDLNKNQPNSTESSKKHSNMIETGNTLADIVPAENTPMETVWRDGSLEVVGPSMKEELDFSENILGH